MRLFICLLLLVCFATSSWAFFAPGRLQNDEPTLLETVSLSINGDFGINKLWVGIKKIAEGVFERKKYPKSYHLGVINSLFL